MILMLLVLLGSGSFLAGSSPVHAPASTGEDPRTAAFRDVLSTPEPSAADPAEPEEETSTTATGDQGGKTTGDIRVPGTTRFPLRARMVQR